MTHRAALDVAKSGFGLLLGLFVAFSGYRMARKFAALAGFIIGFAVGLLVGVPGGPIVSFVVAIVLGIVFVLLFLFAFRFVGAALGLSIGYSLASEAGWPIWAVIIAVIVGFAIGYAINKWVIVGATAILGAWLATRSAFELMHDLNMTLPFDRDVAGYAITAVIAILGGLVQWQGLRHEAP